MAPRTCVAVVHFERISGRFSSESHGMGVANALA
jgi:hypothetical protein